MKYKSRFNYGMSPESWVKVGAFILIVGLGVAINIANPEFYGQMWELATSGSMEQIVEGLRAYGPWAMVISLLLDIFINALGFLPSIFISTANGVVFGLVVGTLISWLAESIGVIISFWLMRFFLRMSAEKLIAKNNFLMRIDDFSGKNGFKMMLIARSIPYFPSGIITALGAVSKINNRDYIFATFLGKFPAVALEVVVGHDIVNFEQNLFRLTIVIIGATIAYYLVWRIHQKHLKKIRSEETLSSTSIENKSEQNRSK